MDIRVNIRSVRPMMALSAGTKDPTCARKTATPTYTRLVVRDERHAEKHAHKVRAGMTRGNTCDNTRRKPVGQSSTTRTVDFSSGHSSRTQSNTIREQQSSFVACFKYVPYTAEEITPPLDSTPPYMRTPGDNCFVLGFDRHFIPRVWCLSPGIR